MSCKWRMQFDLDTPGQGSEEEKSELTLLHFAVNLTSLSTKPPTQPTYYCLFIVMSSIHMISSILNHNEGLDSGGNLVVTQAVFSLKEKGGEVPQGEGDKGEREEHLRYWTELHLTSRGRLDPGQGDLR